MLERAQQMRSARHDAVRHRLPWFRPRRIAGAGAAGLTLWVLGAFALDAYGRRELGPGTYDAIVVAGCKVDPGGEPSPTLRRRVRRAVELYREGRAPLLVFTGGVGDHPPAEAEVAARVAVGMGVAPAAIVREDRSTTTEENARFSAAVVPPSVRRVLVVSDTYHVLRCEWLFGRHYDEARGTGSVPGPWVRVRYALREVGALAIEAVRGVVSAPRGATRRGARLR
jgi:uncharacterized SAM-binding protein YcdF (DUF218 family)